MSRAITIKAAQQSHLETVESLLTGTGITLNGSNPWDIQINDPDFFRQVLSNGSIGLGESYMQGKWDCEQIDEMIARLLKNNVDENFSFSLKNGFYWLQTRLFNLQSRRRAWIVGQKHYDLGNDLFHAMLDTTLSYSCAYWKEATTLEEAQLAKLDLIARKLDLKPGMKLLDVGCGWGSFAKYAAQNYGCEVVGITISQAQAEFAQQQCQGLPVEILLQDYRSLQGKFDRIVSIGMFEHVGYKNYRAFFTTLKKLLAPQGLFLLHTIGTNQTNLASDPWLNKYIFPNGVLPSQVQLTQASEDQLVMEDWQNFGPDYDRTLQAWLRNLDQAWPTLQYQYDQTTYRMLRYYLMSCAGAFRARKTQLWQILFSDFAVERYDAPR